VLGQIYEVRAHTRCKAQLKLGTNGCFTRSAVDFCVTCPPREKYGKPVGTAALFHSSVTQHLDHEVRSHRQNPVLESSKCMTSSQPQMLEVTAVLLDFRDLCRREGQK